MINYFGARGDYQVFGPQGGIPSSLVLPTNFNSDVDRCPIIILMHGFLSRKELNQIPAIAEQLAETEIAFFRFDFYAHGKSIHQVK